MKIVHLVGGGDIAGGQLVALRLAHAARARGDEVAFVSPTPGPFLDLAAGEGFAVAIADVGRTYRLRGGVRLVRLLRRFRADVLHTHVHLAAGVLGRAAGRAAGAAVISHQHIENHFRPQRLPAALLRGLDNASARLCARILAVSDDTRHAFERQGYPAGLMETVRNGIDPPAARAEHDGVRRELGVPPEAPLAGEIARLCDVKGQRELIQAAARVPGLHVLLVGRDIEAGGAFQAALEGEAEALGVRERVVFAGYRPDRDAVLAELDLFVLPSWIEGLPLVVLEAMTHGLPVVATPVGGTPEVVVDGETGLLVPPRDPERLADAIARVVGDRELARRLGEAGRARVAERFSASAMERRVLEIYDEVAAAR
jgi:glycosyltransferase involved in cell wall biosynthesis